MTILYFLPDVSPGDLSAATLKTFDPPDDGRPYHRAYCLTTALSELIDCPDLISDLIFSNGCVGPDGRKGVIFCLRPENGTEPDLRYNADRQIWQSWNAGGRPFYVGADRENPPTPRVLERGRHFAGEPVILGDGSEWIAPIVRLSGITPSVPCEWRLDPDTGQMSETPDDRFRWAWDLSGECFEEIFGGKKRLGNGEHVDRFAACALLLSLNYRVSLIECSLFLASDNSGGLVSRPLINSETSGHIIRTAVDAGLIEQMIDKPEVKQYLRDLKRSDPLEKKNADTGEKSSSGTGSTDG